MTRINSPALLIGSVPLETAEEVFLESADVLGDVVDSFPDGEVGERINWIQYVVAHAYRPHPDLELMSDDDDGGPLEQPKDGASLEERAAKSIRFQLKEGVKEIHFDDLSYVEPAVDSYRTFVRLRDEGKIPSGARFQFAFPAAASSVMPFFGKSEEWPIIMNAYLDVLEREIKAILEQIPAEDLVIQFDMAAEVRDMYLGDDRSIPWAPDRSVEEKWAWHLPFIERLAGFVPEDIPLGYHLCFGTWGGWPHTPGVEDGGVCVRLSNEVVARASRPVDFVHIPILPSCDENYAAPFADLDIGDTRTFMGLVYHDSLEDQAKRIDVLKQHVPDFGVAWYCGLGRMPQDEVRPILQKIHDCAGQL